MPLGIVGTSFPFCVSARLLRRQQHKRNLMVLERYLTEGRQ